ncbi:DTW domain-containing protein YfiP [Herminiimonas fonticola]|uniref:tRNA-uridine aminocarboxypropyltransferase n=2 Tax=Herminiimonas fonticola TaxID=303380 RepID=A0A4R6G6W0_9BURK|nr:DTW domain-containing protein YfiP [Herminiimonas fonticola]
MTSIKRALCTKCLRPQRTCICRWITPTGHEVEVLFLQHPLEIDNAKGSARLLHLSLARSQIITGEVFAEDELRGLLYAPFPHRQDNDQRQKTILPLLLYPSTSEDGNIATPPVLTIPADNTAIQYRLVVIDGTWRKSRKMLYLNPLLQQLPRLPLSDPPASHYRIRKAHKPDQLSTYEATCHALMQLENETEKYLPLLAAFDGFVEQISSYDPKSKESEI